MTHTSHPQPRRRGGHLQAVGDGFVPLEHRPWCDPLEHTGTECRSQPIELHFPGPGTRPGALASASMHLFTLATPDAPTVTRARLRLNAEVFELGVEQAAAIGAGLQSVMLQMIGAHQEAAAVADKARSLAAPAHPVPAAAEL